MTPFFIPKHTCVCGYTMDASMEVMRGNSAPHEGDISICSGCSRVWIFNADLSMRMPTPEEEESIMKDPDVVRARAAVNTIKNLPGI